ncbi:hypothetical protein PISMIDRAFT_681017 [Pisolithus microcarpus 441]|uniref:DUF6741 domain-containing protein n=1 Tax=Pisolithus microcarpus 441 TaxID=765257 RepID=A0A0C9YY89_9AGAM|nr:hypothetical protein BKA83DRAFT_4183265 [Pisolithus microcarpus]KIK21751.1 hypothetical protein PISMIDRAFT_681017 [Pisolithus microcarpus 441]
MAFSTAYSSYSADPYYTGSRSRRPSLGYLSTPASFRSGGVPLTSSSYYDPLPQTYPYPSYGGNLSNPYLPRSYDDLSYRDSHYRTPSVHPISIHRPRRGSSVSYSSVPSFGGGFSPYSRGGGGIVKFKRKGAFRSGITLGEAQANILLSGQDSYTLEDLSVDYRGKIFVHVRWPGYSPLTYEIPVDSYSGLVDLHSLVRRVGRAVSHYMQSNAIPMSWNHVEIQYMEEMSPGSWHLKMNVH